MVDSHCHLAGPEFAADLPQVVERASAAGLSAALCILSEGNQEEDAAATRLGALWPSARFATGIHPHNAAVHAGRVASGIEELERRVHQYRALAIGEIGLDYHYDFSPRAIQLEVFGAQLALARKLALPVIIHTREATGDTLRVLEQEAPGVRGVFHCFTGDEAMVRAVLDLGFYVSFAGIVTFPRAEGLRQAARLVPDDRLLVETDAPYLAPVPHRGKRNEPAFVAQVVSQLAEVRGVTAGDLAAATTDSFHALFGGNAR